MRLLEKNKQTMYISMCTGETDELDSDGLYTGNKIKTFSNPILTKVNLFPSKGTIANQVFGETFQCDMFMVTVGTPFSKNDVFYLPENLEVGNYDYYIADMKKSKSNTYYALKKRV